MGSETFVLAIDQGTTSTRAILFDAAGQARKSAQIALTQLHPRPGWVEHDPEEIWRSVVSTCREAIAAADSPIAAIGITNQRETAVLWERATGRPVHNAIVWQDRRTAAMCERWHTAGLAEIVGLRTGLVIVDRLACKVGYRPYTPIEEGISRFVDWYREHYKV